MADKAQDGLTILLRSFGPQWTPHPSDLNGQQDPRGHAAKQAIRQLRQVNVDPTSGGGPGNRVGQV